MIFDSDLDAKLKHQSHWATTISMTNIAPTVNDMKSVANARVVPYNTEQEAFRGIGVSRRWSGLGPEPADLEELMPQSIIKVQDGTLWEIDGIVEHKRSRSGATEYLVRYKGYGPEYDEWLGEESLDTAVGAIKEYRARYALLPQ
jgi:hypothetical protein